MAEALDIYDEQMNHIGVKERSAVHRDGDWHRVFHCWIAYRDSAGKDFMVMQRRGPNQETYPNFLDITAAGHYQAGETIEDGIREVEEELGIHVRFDALIPLGIRIGVGRYKDIIDHQFEHVFLLIHDEDIADYQYLKSEVAGLVALPVDEALELFAGERGELQARAVGFYEGDLTLTLSDFITNIDRYTYRMLILAKRALNGEKYLAI